MDYYAKVFSTWTIAVAPHYTSQDCSVCGTRVKKSLSTRTHKCPKCGTVMHRDHNAAIMILNKGLKSTVGHTESLKLEEFDPLAGLERSCSVKIGL